MSPSLIVVTVPLVQLVAYLVRRVVVVAFVVMIVIVVMKFVVMMMFVTFIVIVVVIAVVVKLLVLVLVLLRIVIEDILVAADFFVGDIVEPEVVNIRNLTVECSVDGLVTGVRYESFQSEGDASEDNHVQ